jgi:hypothetical protein
MGDVRGRGGEVQRLDGRKQVIGGRRGEGRFGTHKHATRRERVSGIFFISPPLFTEARSTEGSQHQMRLGQSS